MRATCTANAPISAPPNPDTAHGILQKYTMMPHSKATTRHVTNTLLRFFLLVCI